MGERSQKKEEGHAMRTVCTRARDTRVPRIARRVRVARSHKLVESFPGVCLFLLPFRHDACNCCPALCSERGALPQGANVEVSERASALALEMEPTLRDAPMAIGSGKIMEPDGVGLELTVSHYYSAPDASDAVYRNAVRFPHFIRFHNAWYISICCEGKRRLARSRKNFPGVLCGGVVLAKCITSL